MTWLSHQCLWIHGFDSNHRQDPFYQKISLRYQETRYDSNKKHNAFELKMRHDSALSENGLCSRRNMSHLNSESVVLFIRTILFTY